MANKFVDCAQCVSFRSNEDCGECDSGQLFEESIDLDLNSDRDFDYDED